MHDCEAEGSGSNTTVAEAANTTVAELNVFSGASLIDLLPESAGCNSRARPAERDRPPVCAVCTLTLSELQLHTVHSCGIQQGIFIEPRPI